MKLLKLKVIHEEGENIIFEITYSVSYLLFSAKEIKEQLKNKSDKFVILK